MRNRLFRGSRKGLRLALLSIAALALFGCASSSDKDLPATTDDGLVLVPDTKVDAVYLAPDVNLGHFNRLYISEVKVAFRKNWMRDQNADRRAASQRVTQEDADRIKAAIAEDFSVIFREELEKGGYQVVDEVDPAGDNEDLLLLVPAIVNLDVTAPDTQSAGRTRSFTATAGSMTLYMELHDSITGALMGRVADSRQAMDTGRVMYTNSVTNKADADRMLRRWATLLVGALDRAHGK